jgi:hypothetical protein
MIYLKGVLIGFGVALLGTPIALMIWAIGKSQGRATVSFSPMGLAHHLAHSLVFWVFIVVLFTAGFVCIFPEEMSVPSGLPVTTRPEPDSGLNVCRYTVAHHSRCFQF